MIISSFEEFKKSKFLISTKNGFIKQISSNELNIQTSKKGVKYISLKNEDEVIGISIICSNDYYVVTLTKNSKIIRYDVSEIPIIGLVSLGVKNIGLEVGDFVVSSQAENKKIVDEGTHQLILFTNNGKSKRFKSNEIKITSRASKGFNALKQNKANPHNVIAMYSTTNEEFNVQILFDDKKRMTIENKTHIPLTTLDEGLNNLNNHKIEAISENVALSMNKCKQTQKTIKEIKEVEQQTLELALEEALENSLKPNKQKSKKDNSFDIDVEDIFNKI